MNARSNTGRQTSAKAMQATPAALPIHLLIRRFCHACRPSCLSRWISALEPAEKTLRIFGRTVSARADVPIIAIGVPPRRSTIVQLASRKFYVEFAQRFEDSSAPAVPHVTATQGVGEAMSRSPTPIPSSNPTAKTSYRVSRVFRAMDSRARQPL